MASSRVLYLVVLIALFLRVQGDEFYVCGATSPTSPSDPPPIDPLNLPYKELLMNLSTPVLSCNKSSCTEGETFFEVSACSKDAGINWYWYGSADFQDPLPNKTILVQVSAIFPNELTQLRPKLMYMASSFAIMCLRS